MSCRMSMKLILCRLQNMLAKRRHRHVLPFHTGLIFLPQPKKCIFDREDLAVLQAKKAEIMSSFLDLIATKEELEETLGKLHKDIYRLQLGSFKS